MCGNRDSEVCLAIEDTEFVPSTMNGQPYQAGKFALSLRKQLMSEHLCLQPDLAYKNKVDKDVSLDDPIIDSFYNDIWLKAADNNTHIYEEVFRCYPTNLVSEYFNCF
jgi:phospholipase D1/2